MHSYETIIFVNRSRFNEVHFDTDVNTTLSYGYSYVTCGRDTVMYHHLEEKQDRKNVVNYSGSGNVTLIHSHIVHVKMEGSCTFRLTKPEGMHGLEYTYDIVLETSSPVYSVSFPSDILWEVPLSLEANRRYEISIRDNVALWTSSEIPVVQ